MNAISAEVWNKCIKIDRDYRKINKKGMTLSMLEFETKQNFPLHAKGIHHAVFKYYHARNSMWESMKKNHENSRKVKLPYKKKKYLPTGWDSQSINAQKDKNIIKLSGIKNRGQIICHVKNIPDNIVEVELVYKNKYYLAIKYKEIDNKEVVQSENPASIDIGEIHIITSIDSFGNCLIITNRKVRSLVRLKDKRMGEVKSLRSRCIKYSKQYRKYTKAIYKIKFEFDRKIMDALHKQTAKYVNWCIKNNVSITYYGDLDSVTRNKKGKMSKKLNQKLNMWRFGILVYQLNYKLLRRGIKSYKINEAYTSQTCPNCNKRNKPNNRNYYCKCGYKQHRDVVGAINILNKYGTCNLTRFAKKEYLQIC